MLLSVLYIIGITAEGMTGALAAGREKMDIFGVIIIASVTAIGGGSVRDVLLGHYPLGWVKHPEYFLMVATAAVITVYVAPFINHFMRYGFGGIFHHRGANRHGYGIQLNNRLYCRLYHRSFRWCITRFALQPYSSRIPKRTLRQRCLVRHAHLLRFQYAANGTQSRCTPHLNKQLYLTHFGDSFRMGLTGV